jgi:hypothetical protein
LTLFVELADFSSVAQLNQSALHFLLLNFRKLYQLKCSLNPFPRLLGITDRYHCAHCLLKLEIRSGEDGDDFQNCGCDREQ